MQRLNIWTATSRERALITYRHGVEGVGEGDIAGFFVDWPSPPDPKTHLRILRESGVVVIAVDDDTHRVVGFITAITDGVLSAYIPLLEVLPAWQGRGIGQELVRRMLDRLKDLYMIDLLCDEGMQPFYDRLGFQRSSGMVIRNYAGQSGRQN